MHSKAVKAMEDGSELVAEEKVMDAERSGGTGRVVGLGIGCGKLSCGSVILTSWPGAREGY